MTKELVELGQEMYRQGVWSHRLHKINRSSHTKEVECKELQKLQNNQLHRSCISMCLLNILTRRIEGKRVRQRII